MTGAIKSLAIFFLTLLSSLGAFLCGAVARSEGAAGRVMGWWGRGVIRLGGWRVQTDGPERLARRGPPDAGGGPENCKGAGRRRFPRGDAQPRRRDRGVQDRGVLHRPKGGRPHSARLYRRRPARPPQRLPPLPTGGDGGARPGADPPRKQRLLLQTGDRGGGEAPAPPPPRRPDTRSGRERARIQPEEIIMEGGFELGAGADEDPASGVVLAGPG